MRRITESVFALVVGASVSGGQLSSTFDADLNGWICNLKGECAWEMSGGNPGGYVRFTDTIPGETFLIAPAACHGSWLSLDGAGFISFDHRIEHVGPLGEVYPFAIRISGPGGSAEWLGEQPT